MTTHLEERLSRELSTGPSNVTITDSAAFADDIIGRVDRRARRHRAVFTGTIAAFAAAISALAWTARSSLNVSTDSGPTPGEFANSGATTDVDPGDAEAAASAIEAAVQATPGVSTTTTLIALAMLLGLPLLAGFTSWYRPKNSALTELDRVGRAVLMMLLAFFSFVSFTGLLSVRMTDRSTPNLLTELHEWSWIALTILAVVAVVPWFFRFDFATVRAATKSKVWVTIRASLVLPFVYAIFNTVDSQFNYLLHVGYVHLPRSTPLTRSRKIGFLVGAGLLTAIGLAAFTWQVLYMATGSMEPTLEKNTRAIVNRLDTEVARGDIITYQSSRPFSPIDRIRRVVGVGGDFVQGRDGQLLVNGVVPEYFISPEDGGTTLFDFDEVRVPPDELFLMGDNYSGSSDSRHEGTVPIGLVNGTESEFNGG